MYKLKSIARRSTALIAALAVVAGSLIPASGAFADSLNPLTERSLTLSSSSPGWADTDGSGNSTYAPPNSGANGQKTGNYFSFKVSTNSSPTGTNQPITAMSFQYCTGSAGPCQAPGNDTGNAATSTRGSDDSSHSDLNINYPSATEVASGTDFNTVIDSSTGLVKAVPGYTNENPKYIASGANNDPAEAAKNVAGNFIVMTDQAGTWTLSSGWTATTSNQEEDTADPTTGKQNTIILQNSTGLGLTAGTQVKVLFFATGTNYITNPGAGAFFVKINTFKNFTALGAGNTLADNVASGDVIDGGVTVANVMNQSIQITTKVLETMQFSVGTVDPDTLSDAQYKTALGSSTAVTHTPCDRILTAFSAGDPENVLQLGNQSQESSLATDQTYATHSYWRLSSNSSAGATVYYSGHTLSNTSGDEITPIGTSADHSHQGAEQFGLALDTIALPGTGGAFNTGSYGVDYTTAGSNENAADNAASGLVAANTIDNSQLTDVGAVNNSGTWDYTGLNKSYHSPRLDPLTPEANYGGGSGTISNNGTASFAFDKMSDTIPAPIASESNQVVDCVTGKMRYIANIAATTPAGIYTTKVNYIAAPQY